MQRVCDLSDLPDGGSVRLDGDEPVAVFNVGGELFAIDDTCTHQEASLSDGFVEDCQVECPLHAACFDLRTGRPSGPPAKRAVRTHRVEVLDGTVWVARREAPADLPADAPAPAAASVDAA